MISWEELRRDLIRGIAGTYRRAGEVFSFCSGCGWPTKRQGGVCGVCLEKLRDDERRPR
jgi:hypothetical protein